MYFNRFRPKYFSNITLTMFIWTEISILKIFGCFLILNKLIILILVLSMQDFKNAWFNTIYLYTNFSNIKALRIIYCFYMWSILYYCSVIWSPWVQKRVSTLKGVQNKVSGFICHRCNIPRAPSNFLRSNLKYAFSWFLWVA